MAVYLSTSGGGRWAFFFQAEDGIRDLTVTGVQTCALPISEGGRGDAGHAPQVLGGRAATGRGHCAREPVGEGAGQLRHLPRADRGADRQPAFPRLRDAGQLRHDLLDQYRLHRAPPVPRPGGLPALDRADARHPTLLPRADAGDARRHEARLHSAARHHGGTRHLHQLGVAEVQRLHEAMLAAMRETGFGGDFPAFLRFLRTDPRFYARSPEELLMHAAWTAKRFDGKAAQFFGYLPRARFAIKPVPEDLAPFYTAGRGGAGGYFPQNLHPPGPPPFKPPPPTPPQSPPRPALPDTNRE